MKKFLCVSIVALLAAFPVAARTVTPDDNYNLRTVDAPEISPDGQWVAYQVMQSDKKDDKDYTHLWMSRFDGSQTVQLTGRDKESETHARFSPDGRWIAFLSGRTDKKESDQLWLLDRQGGEAQRVTDFPGGVDDIAWSPDSKRIALVVESASKNDTDGDDDDKTAPPIVIDRFRFMEDINGYLTEEHDHLYLFDMASRKADILTPGNYSEGMPAWSPDGKTIAYFSKHHPNGDRDNNFDLMVVAAQKGATPKQIADHGAAGTNAERPDGNEYPAWSPDGKTIAFAQYGDPHWIEYAPNFLSLVSANGGPVKQLTAYLDRNIGAPHWSDDGKSITMLVEDDRTEYLGRISANGGSVQHIAGARDVISEYTTAKGKFALLYSNPTLPPEAFAFDGKTPIRQISHQNEWLKDVQLSLYQEISFKSKDGTEVHGFLLKPPGVTAGHLPTIMRLHGGPQEQLDDSFFLEWQLITAHGYALVASNPRGSTGRGLKYCAGIYANWGGVSVQDVLAAVDYAVKAGVADPNRLGVGGWSYGGMLTNYVIASDTRFKAAISGASIADIFGGYGNDEYAYDYETELGTPWKNVDVWMRNSYPFFHADRIKTPTLFMGGTADMNVPLHNGEQMYQALKSLGVPTELIVYPGQFHELGKPSYEHDKDLRYLAWYDKYVKGKG